MHKGIAAFASFDRPLRRLEFHIADPYGPVAKATVRFVPSRNRGGELASDPIWKFPEVAAFMGHGIVVEVGFQGRCGGCFIDTVGEQIPSGTFHATRGPSFRAGYEDTVGGHPSRF